MTESDEATGKSVGISERRNEGIAGPSRGVSKCDQAMPGSGSAGHENVEIWWDRMHVPNGSDRLECRRKDEERGCS